VEKKKVDGFEKKVKDLPPRGEKKVSYLLKKKKKGKTWGGGRKNRGAGKKSPSRALPEGSRTIGGKNRGAKKRKRLPGIERKGKEVEREGASITGTRSSRSEHPRQEKGREPGSLPPEKKKKKEKKTAKDHQG